MYVYIHIQACVYMYMCVFIYAYMCVYINNIYFIYIKFATPILFESCTLPTFQSDSSQILYLFFQTALNLHEIERSNSITLGLKEAQNVYLSPQN